MRPKAADACQRDGSWTAELLTTRRKPGGGWQPWHSWRYLSFKSRRSLLSERASRARSSGAVVLIGHLPGTCYAHDRSKERKRDQQHYRDTQDAPFHEPASTVARWESTGPSLMLSSFCPATLARYARPTSVRCNAADRQPEHRGSASSASTLFLLRHLSR